MPDRPDVPEVVAALQAANGRLRTEYELEAENAELRERIARPERLISRDTSPSSMPPNIACSAAAPMGSSLRQRVEPSGRARGGARLSPRTGSNAA
jgi:hypothetical protein